MLSYDEITLPVVGLIVSILQLLDMLHQLE